MRLDLNRLKPIGSAQPGDLYIDGKWVCFTLEDQVRPDPNPATPENEAKVYGQTAIPEGLYPITLEMSPKFGKLLPRLHGVPGFTGILIHKGNTVEDTLGCILVGMRVTKAGTIAPGTSGPAWDTIFPQLLAAHERKEPIEIVIVDYKEAFSAPR